MQIRSSYGFDAVASTGEPLTHSKAGCNDSVNSSVATGTATGPPAAAKGLKGGKRPSRASASARDVRVASEEPGKVVMSAGAAERKASTPLTAAQLQALKNKELERLLKLGSIDVRARALAQQSVVPCVRVRARAHEHRCAARS